MSPLWLQGFRPRLCPQARDDLSPEMGHIMPDLSSFSPGGHLQHYKGPRRPTVLLLLNLCPSQKIMDQIRGVFSLWLRYIPWATCKTSATSIPLCQIIVTWLPKSVRIRPAQIRDNIPLRFLPRYPPWHHCYPSVYRSRSHSFLCHSIMDQWQFYCKCLTPRHGHVLMTRNSDELHSVCVSGTSSCVIRDTAAGFPREVSYCSSSKLSVERSGPCETVMWLLLAATTHTEIFNVLLPGAKWQRWISGEVLRKSLIIHIPYTSAQIYEDTCPKLMKTKHANENLQNSLENVTFRDNHVNFIHADSFQRYRVK